MALSTEEAAELASLRAQLAAQSAGQAVKVTEVAGRRAEFFAPNVGVIERRIAELEGRATGCRRRGAIGFRL